MHDGKYAFLMGVSIWGKSEYDEMKRKNKPEWRDLRSFLMRREGLSAGLKLVGAIGAEKGILGCWKMKKSEKIVARCSKTKNLNSFIQNLQVHLSKL